MRGFGRYNKVETSFVMGLTVLDVEVAIPSAPEKTRTVQFLIDSARYIPWCPRRFWRSLAFTPLTEKTFRLADGTKISRKRGVAIFKYKDEIGGADVIFGEPGDSTLLGVFTLEALGLVLDPLRRKSFCRYRWCWEATFLAVTEEGNIVAKRL